MIVSDIILFISCFHSVTKKGSLQIVAPRRLQTLLTERRLAESHLPRIHTRSRQYATHGMLQGKHCVGLPLSIHADRNLRPTELKWNRRKQGRRRSRS
ncbi:hypothetical protein RB195_001661 [Necator americanus]|uniref:Secreted protein n=1 Tax=Necator americanus TaxID=51031 RepID=A0ABR1DFC2_NECAM